MRNDRGSKHAGVMEGFFFVSEKIGKTKKGSKAFVRTKVGRHVCALLSIVLDIVKTFDMSGRCLWVPMPEQASG